MRFIQNSDKGNSNLVYSRTIGKVAFVDKSYRGPRPNPGEFWLSDIIRETEPGKVKGCFLVEPFNPVKYEDLVPLTPQVCTVVNHGYGVLVVEPFSLDSPDGRQILWILTLRHREALRNPQVIATVVNLGGKVWEKVTRANPTKA